MVERSDRCHRTVMRADFVMSSEVQVSKASQRVSSRCLHRGRRNAASQRRLAQCLRIGREAYVRLAQKVTGVRIRSAALGALRRSTHLRKYIL